MFKANKNKVWAPDKSHYIIDRFAEAVKKILNVQKLSNLNNHIQTTLRVIERQLKNYPKGKISSLLKEEPLPL